MTENSQRLPRSLVVDLLVIFGAAAALTLVAMLFDLDRRIAPRILQPGAGLGEMAESASVASFVAAGLGLLLLAVPALRRRWPLAARAAGVFAATLLIAVLAIIGAMKTEINRPRPDQTRELGGDYGFRQPFDSEPDCDCKAFPSNAAGFGFVLASPYFVLRRRWPGLAVALLVAGLAWGGLIGYGRMVAGRHWLTDIVWSAAVVLAVASLLGHLTVAWRSERHAT
jgi:membrane-associated PAP2 superfamily phosphatase